MLDAHMNSEDTTEERKVMLTTDELTVEVASLDYPHSSVRAEREAYYAQISVFQGQWAAWLADEYAKNLPATMHELIFGRAWADGHSSGYNEIENCYRDHADFAKAIVRAVDAVEATFKGVLLK